MKRVIAAVAVFMAITVLATSTASAATVMRANYFPNGRPTSQIDGNACVARASVWQQELGASGINRLRAKFERRAPYDTGIPGTAYASTGWLYSAAFPDDPRSFWVGWKPQFRFELNHRYQMRAVMVGERPSFWQRNVKTAWSMGEIGCDGYIVSLSS